MSKATRTRDKVPYSELSPYIKNRTFNFIEINSSEDTKIDLLNGELCIDKQIYYNKCRSKLTLRDKRSSTTSRRTKKVKDGLYTISGIYFKDIKVIKTSGPTTFIMDANLLSVDSTIQITARGNSVIQILSDSTNIIYKEISIVAINESKVYINSMFQNGIIKARDKSAITGLHIRNIVSMESSAEADLDIKEHVPIFNINHNDPSIVNRYLLGNIMDSVENTRTIVDSSGCIINLRFTDNTNRRSQTSNNPPSISITNRSRIRNDIRSTPSRRQTTNNNNNEDESVNHSFSIQYSSDGGSVLPRNSDPSEIVFQQLYNSSNVSPNTLSNNFYRRQPNILDFEDRIIIEDDRPYVPSRGRDSDISKFELINQKEEDEMAERHDSLKEKKEKGELTSAETKELEKIEKMELCPCCYSRPKKVASNECGHVYFCIKCANQMIKMGDLKCPICKVRCKFIPIIF